jgi:hypothetical protein
MFWKVGIILLSVMSLVPKFEIYRLVAIARGEQEYFDPSGVATATEACKSNALMRCCKDLGIASELWWVSHTVFR